MVEVVVICLIIVVLVDDESVIDIPKTSGGRFYTCRLALSVPYILFVRPLIYDPVKTCIEGRSIQLFIRRQADHWGSVTGELWIRDN